MTLSIPTLPPDADVLTAALAYARCGWYVAPLHPETKRPNLGTGWPLKTSRDAEEIVAWFAGSSDELGLHVGRSGAVALDIDNPDLLPEELAKACTPDVPYQSTRIDSPGRGHWLFLQPEGRRLGNSRGRFGTSAWGEVRGQNGILAVAPSRHSKSGGRYQWITTGDLQVLPESISEGLPDALDAESVASDRDVKAFIASATGARRPSLLRAVGQSFTLALTRGSRHEALVDALAWGMREAAAGEYPAQSVIDMLLPDFERALRNEPGRRPVLEFQGVLAWAVSQALSIDPEQRAAEVAARVSATSRVDNNGAPIVAAVAAPAGAPTPAVLRQASGVQLQAQPLSTGTQPRPANDYFDRETGLHAQKLADDIMAMGELAFGRDKDFWTYGDGVWTSAPKVIAKRSVWLLRDRFRKSHAENASVIVQHSIPTITCDPTEDYINFTNGMLNWRTDDMEPHAPHYGSTVQLPVEYDPDATCPVFEQFLGQILSEDYQRYMWETIGYLMMSGNPLQCAFMFLGTGSNGKGTLMRVLMDLLGRDNCSAISLDSLTMNRFAPAGLFGKIANIAGDIDATYQENTAPFKLLTGEDTYNGERKFGEPFPFISWAVPVFSANKAPGSSDTTKGYLRRWKIIEFTTTIEEKDAIPGLSHQLARELPGIAAKGVRALRELMARNNGRGGFFSSEEIDAGKERFAETIDQVRTWVADATIPHEDHVEKLSACYKSYKFWASEQGNKHLKSSEFEQRLKSLPGITTGKTNGNRWVKGLGIVQYRFDAAPEPDAEKSPV